MFDFNRTRIRSRAERLMFAPFPAGRVLMPGIEEALFFWLYTRMSRQTIYLSLSAELLEKAVITAVNEFPGIKGWAGLGFILELMDRDGVICLDRNGLMTEIDRRIMRYDMHRHQDSYELSAIQAYADMRCNDPNSMTVLDKHFIDSITGLPVRSVAEYTNTTPALRLWTILMTTLQTAYLTNNCALVGDILFLNKATSPSIIDIWRQ